MSELGEVKRAVAEYEAKGNIDRAVEELEGAVQEFPNEGSLFNKLGDLYLKVNRETDALDVYERGARVFKDPFYEFSVHGNITAGGFRRGAIGLGGRHGCIGVVFSQKIRVPLPASPPIS